MNQRDLICETCPLLPDCDEESLWCAFRWATDPNAAQLSIVTSEARQAVFDRGGAMTNAERSKKWRERNPERYAEVRRNYRKRKAERSTPNAISRIS